MRNLIADGITSLCYFINEQGDIFNKEGKKLSPVLGRGYQRVRLCRDLPRRLYSVHRLVAETFIPNPKSLPMINHKDGDKTNNNVLNLEWCNNSHNQIHRFRELGWKGTKIRPVLQYTLDGEFVREWDSAIYATRELGICNQNICKVCKGERKQAGGFNWKYK